MEDQIHIGMALKNVQLHILTLITREYLVCMQGQTVMKGQSQGQIKWNEQYHKTRKEDLLDEFSKLQQDSGKTPRKVMVYWTRRRNPSGACWMEGALFLLLCTESLLMSSHNILRPIKPDTCEWGNKWALEGTLDYEKKVCILFHVQRGSIFWTLSHGLCAYKTTYP